jgi:hypothetical protein
VRIAVGEENNLLGCNATQSGDNSIFHRNRAPPSFETHEYGVQETPSAGGKQRLLGLLFNPESGSKVFLRNIGLFERHSITTQMNVHFTKIVVLIW